MQVRSLVVLAALAAPAVAWAQPAPFGAPMTMEEVRHNFSYSAPSGMFGEATTKWQNFRFMFEDKARMAGAAGPSIQGSAVSSETVRRPGERGRRTSR